MLMAGRYRLNFPPGSADNIAGLPMILSVRVAVWEEIIEVDGLLGIYQQIGNY